MKYIFKISLLILGCSFLSIANAEICKETYKKQRFDHVTIWKDDHVVYCNYRGSGHPPDYDEFYLLVGYVPKEGPWQHDKSTSSCFAAAEDCHFKKVAN